MFDITCFSTFLGSLQTSFQAFYQYINSVVPVSVHLHEHLPLDRDLVTDVLGAEDGLQVEPGCLHLEPRVKRLLHTVLENNRCKCIYRYVDYIGGFWNQFKYKIGIK